jgi:hypothetical protein
LIGYAVTGAHLYLKIICNSNTFIRLLVLCKNELVIVSADSEDRGHPYPLAETGDGIQVTPDGAVAYVPTMYGFYTFNITTSYNLSTPQNHDVDGGPWMDLAIDIDAPPHTVFLLNTTTLINSLDVGRFDWSLPIQPKRLITREKSLLVLGSRGFLFRFDKHSTVGTEPHNFDCE